MVWSPPRAGSLHRGGDGAPGPQGGPGLAARFSYGAGRNHPNLFLL